jgi:hypothetical protein
MDDTTCPDCKEEFTKENPQCGADTEFGCESCVDCCLGHCIHCQHNSSQHCGGRYLDGDDFDLFGCSLCENVFHMSNYCKEGGYRCKRCATVFCVKCNAPPCKVKASKRCTKTQWTDHKTY